MQSRAWVGRPAAHLQFIGGMLAARRVRAENGRGASAASAWSGATKWGKTGPQQQTMDIFYKAPREAGPVQPKPAELPRARGQTRISSYFSPTV